MHLGRTSSCLVGRVPVVLFVPVPINSFKQELGHIVIDILDEATFFHDCDNVVSERTLDMMFQQGFKYFLVVCVFFPRLNNVLKFVRASITTTNYENIMKQIICSYEKLMKQSMNML